jgi:hypothetical protein
MPSARASCGEVNATALPPTSFDDMDATRLALSAHGPETQADVPNFTDVAPVVLIGVAKPG